MTFSNGGWNPNPFANPFNTRLGQSNYCLNPLGQSYRPNVFNSKKTDLPDPEPYIGEAGLDLHVPDTTPPMDFRSLLNMIDDYARDKTWDDRLIFLDMLNRSSKDVQGLSRRDIEYWKKAEIESAKLSANMTDEQKEMLEQMKKLGMFDSKLEEVPDDDLKH